MRDAEHSGETKKEGTRTVQTQVVQKFCAACGAAFCTVRLYDLRLRIRQLLYASTRGMFVPLYLCAAPQLPFVLPPCIPHNLRTAYLVGVRYCCTAQCDAVTAAAVPKLLTDLLGLPLSAATPRNF